MGSWNREQHHVTQSFDEWLLTSADIRAYLRFVWRIGIDEYERIWEQLRDELQDDHFDIADVASLADDLVRWDFEWMLLASVIKDGVTAFEVYLEHVQDEILSALGRPKVPGENAPRWDELTTFFRVELGVALKGHQDLRKVRDLRHLLTHRRGELRTQKLRQQFAATDFQYDVDLTVHDARQALDVLAGHAERLDEPAYAIIWA